MRFRLPEPGLARALRRSRSAIRPADAARNRGLSTTWPSLAVRKRATPTSTPILRPVAVDEPGLPEPGVRLEPGIAVLLTAVPLRVPGTLEERGERIPEPAQG